MSFNDPFLKDLENLSESSQEEEEKQADEDAISEADDDSFVEPELHETHEDGPIDKFSRLKTDSAFNQLLVKVADDSKEVQTEVDDALLQLINTTNAFLRQLTPDSMSVLKTAQALFQKRFPELESIILDPVDYARTILAIGNEEQVEGLA